MNDGKRSEGRADVPAVMALARLRVDVIWAMLRDDRPFIPQEAPAAA